MKTKYEEIEKAVKILNLSEEATLRQIKEHYRKLITKWHPDKCKQDFKKCIEMSQKIIEAYELIIEYCNHYKYSFFPSDDLLLRSNICSGAFDFHDHCIDCRGENYRND